MKPKPIGIIGGAGPLAAVSLLEQIFSLARDQYGCWKDQDFPEVFFISFPFSDMLSETIDAPLIQQELSSCLQKLRANGALVIGIACNTLHTFLSLKNKSEEDLFLIPKIVAEKINEETTPLILCTSTSLRFNLYTKYIPCLYPTPSTQEIVDRIITQILKGENVLESLKNLIKQQDADIIVLGCTELSLYAK
ncbi:MAG: hypothetical protein FJZ63_07890, partial [Chlamydiae bacterium]|nr:hypothetical protein [Chlamydiota bacterium]